MIKSNMNYFEQLPVELLSSILVQLPIDDIRRLARVSSYCASFCRTEDFWVDKAQHDFNLHRKLFFTIKNVEIPRVKYWFIHWSHKDINLAICASAADNHVELIKYWITRATKNLDDAVGIAARYNCCKAINYLITQGADINMAILAANNDDLRQKLVTVRDNK
jgi:hypothetical protein